MPGHYVQGLPGREEREEGRGSSITVAVSALFIPTMGTWSTAIPNGVASEVVMLAVLLPATPNADALSAGFHETLLKPEILVDRLEV